MQIKDWYNILYIITSLLSIYIFFRIAYTHKSLAFVFFGLAILSFLTGVSLGYTEMESVLARDWGDLVGITLVLCALFVKIRESKPVFARFPIALTFLPLISVLFYPMIADAGVVKNLLTITYQGGAIIVGILLIGINQFMHRKRMLLLLACVLFLGAYISFWFVTEGDVEVFQNVGSILFTVGMVVTAIGFKKAVKIKTK